MKYERPLKSAIVQIISAYSEDYYCAGWLIGIESITKELILNRLADSEFVDSMRGLAAMLGKWPVGFDGDYSGAWDSNDPKYWVELTEAELETIKGLIPDED